MNVVSVLLHAHISSRNSHAWRRILLSNSHPFDVKQLTLATRSFFAHSQRSLRLYDRIYNIASFHYDLLTIL